MSFGGWIQFLNPPYTRQVHSIESARVWVNNLRFFQLHIAMVSKFKLPVCEDRID